jgi:hypothetical protein
LGASLVQAIPRSHLVIPGLWWQPSQRGAGPTATATAAPTTRPRRDFTTLAAFSSSLHYIQNVSHVEGTVITILAPDLFNPIGPALRSRCRNFWNDFEQLVVLTALTSDRQVRYTYAAPYQN